MVPSFLSEVCSTHCSFIPSLQDFSVYIPELVLMVLCCLIFERIVLFISIHFSIRRFQLFRFFFRLICSMMCHVSACWIKLLLSMISYVLRCVLVISVSHFSIVSNTFQALVRSSSSWMWDSIAILYLLEVSLAIFIFYKLTYSLANGNVWNIILIDQFLFFCSLSSTDKALHIF